jgi:hypothetical protein
MHIRYLYTTQHVHYIWLTATNTTFTESTQFPLCLVLTNNTLILKCSSFYGYYDVSNSKKLTFQYNTVPPSLGSRSWISLALLDPEDDINMLHQNIGNYLPADVAPQHLRWPKPSSMPLSKAQVEQYVCSPHPMEWFTVQPLCSTALHIST